MSKPQALEEYMPKFNPKEHLLSLKGKDYLPVASRLVWLNEEAARFAIEPKCIKLEDGYAIVQATVTIFDENGDTLKAATATKREDKLHFADFYEKAETGAIGRALGLLGFGTQFAPEFDERDTLPPEQPKPQGEPRVVDAPQAPKQTTQPTAKTTPSKNGDVVSQIQQAFNRLAESDAGALEQKSNVYVGATFKAIMTANGGLYKRPAEQPAKLERLLAELEALLA